MSEAWHQVNFQSFMFERIIGFSIPVDEQLAVISYDAVYLVRLDNQGEVVKDSQYPEGGDIYDQERQLLSYRGTEFNILGLYGGNPLLLSRFGESVNIDKEREVASVQEADGRLTLQFPFEDFSGDWVYASFSEDSTYFLLGMPYDLYAFRRA